jgi:hypothetical protein
MLSCATHDMVVGRIQNPDDIGMRNRHMSIEGQEPCTCPEPAKGAPDTKRREAK